MALEADLTSISCGIPQGSVLGPIFFFYYILMTFIFVQHSLTSTFLLLMLQQNIIVSMWLRSNKLSLNIQNSSLVIFHPPQKKISCDFQLILENKCSNQEKCIKYLSVFIDFKFVMEITILQPLFYRKPVFYRKELFAL